MLWDHYLCLAVEHFLIIPNGNFISFLISPCPWALATTNLFSVSMDLPILDISYK